MRKNHNINLLPPRLQQQRRRQTLICVLAAAQVVVFLLLGGIFLHMRGAENRLQARSAALTTHIAAIIQTLPETNDTPNEVEQAEFEWVQTLQSLPPGFDYAWLQTILDSIPQNSTLLSLEFDGISLVVTAMASGFDVITEHISILDADGLFETTHLGATQRLDNGQTRYTLQLTPMATTHG